MVRRICARKEPWKLKGRVLQLDVDDGSGSIVRLSRGILVQSLRAGLRSGFHYRAEAYETGHGRKVKRQYAVEEEEAAEKAPKKKAKKSKKAARPEVEGITVTKKSLLDD